MPSLDEKSLERQIRLAVWVRFLWWRLKAYLRGISIDFFPGRNFGRFLKPGSRKIDVKSGTNVALLAFPQSIAYALIAGVPTQAGLIGSALGAIVGPLFSGSRFIVLGPTNATAVLLGIGLVSASIPESERFVALPLFILLVGFFQLVGALARLSVFFNYVSRTVVTGYITAAALLIIVNQVQNVFGFKVSGESTFLGVLVGTIKGLPVVKDHLPEVLIAAAALLVNLLVKRLSPKLPNVAVTLLVTAVLGVVLDRFWGWKVNCLSGFSLDQLQIFTSAPSFSLIGKLTLPAMALAFISVLEGSSIGKSLAARSGERIDINQEMYSMGVSNLACSLFGGMAASGSLTRSALNFSSGARTPMAAIFSGVLVLVMMFSVGLFFIQYIPTAALAVMVIAIALSLFNRRHIHAALHTTGSDALTFFVTFGAALLLTLDAAIYIGALTSIVLFLRKAGTPELVEYNFNQSGQLAEATDKTKRGTPGISILHAEGDLFFGSTDIFIDQTRQVMQDPDLKIIILRMKNARNLDATCVLAIEELYNFLRQNDRHLLVSGADRDIKRVFEKSGVMKKIGRENFFPEIPGNPTVSTRNALKRAQQILGKQQAEIRIFVDAARQAKEQAAQQQAKGE